MRVGTCEAINGHDILKRIYSADGSSPTLNTCGGGNTEPKIIDPQGRISKVNKPKDVSPTLRAQDHGNPPCVIDDMYANRPARVYEDCAPTLRGERNGLKVVEPQLDKVGNVYPSGGQNGNVYNTEGLSPTISSGTTNTKGNGGIGSSNAPKIVEPFISKENYVGEFLPINNATTKGYLKGFPCDGIYTQTGNKRGTVQPGMAQTLTTREDKGVILPGLRVRKLTPCECWKLQGFKETEFKRAEGVVSKTQLYKQAGNSVTVSVIVALLSQLGFGDKKWNDMTADERSALIFPLAA